MAKRKNPGKRYHLQKLKEAGEAVDRSSSPGTLRYYGGRMAAEAAASRKMGVPESKISKILRIKNPKGGKTMAKKKGKRAYAVAGVKAPSLLLFGAAALGIWYFFIRKPM